MKEELTLLEKKDQQIRRLQSELEEQRRRAESAVAMLDNCKNMHARLEEGSQGLKSEVSKRIKAEEELRQAEERNVGGG